MVTLRTCYTYTWRWSSLFYQVIYLLVSILPRPRRLWKLKKTKGQEGDRSTEEEGVEGGHSPEEGVEDHSLSCPSSWIITQGDYLGPNGCNIHWSWPWRRLCVFSSTTWMNALIFWPWSSPRHRTIIVFCVLFRTTKKHTIHFIGLYVFP